MTQRPRFRPDIEGLRAIAVVLVMVYHAGLPASGGYIGVDVFFVISGFLITGLLLRESDATGGIALVSFYARRAKRLLPAASLVLLTTTGLTWRFAPPDLRETYALDIASAAAYFVNWRFAHRSVDYLAEDVLPSPVLHFWSLAVEEQFYLLWPLIILGALGLAARLRARPRPMIALGLCLVIVPSLAWSVHFTAHSPPEAFFVTTTRLWELGAGALLALATPRLPASAPRWAGAAAVAGLVLIGASAVSFDDTTAWPGSLAAAPTLGTCLLIAAGTMHPRGVITRALGTAPMMWIGGLSYSLYLWHWPLVVLGRDWLEWTGAGWGTALVLASVLPAWLSYRFVEQPIRHARVLDERTRLTLSLGLNLTLATVLAALVLFVFNAAAPSSMPTIADTSVARGGALAALGAGIPQAGARALGRDPTRSEAGVPRDSYAQIVPKPVSAAGDRPSAYGLGCQLGFGESQPRWCDIGDPSGDVSVMMVGDSKILQYFDALDGVGRALGWQIRVSTKSACAFTAALPHRDGAPYASCADYYSEIIREVDASRPDIVLTSQNEQRALRRDDPSTPTQVAMIDGLVEAWSSVQRTGSRVVVVLDNPHPVDVGPVYRCMVKHPHEATRCAFDRTSGIAASAAPTQLAAAQRVPGIEVVDLNDFICPRDLCAPVIGDVLVYRKGTHITNHYAQTLAPVLAERLVSAVSAQAPPPLTADSL